MAVTGFNQPGVQLAVTEHGVPSPAGVPMFSEAIITGPPAVLDAMNSPLPPDCRTIASQPSPGGVRPIGAGPPGPDPGAALPAITASAYRRAAAVLYR